jgi:TatD DNase family protein
LAATGETCEAAASHARLGEVRSSEIVLLPLAPFDRSHSRFEALRSNHESAPALRWLRQADACAEESLSVRIPGIDLENGPRSLRENEETSVSVRGFSQGSAFRCRSVSSRGVLELPSAAAMLQLADAHCHLDAHHFPDGPDGVIERGRAAGVIGYVVVGLARVDAAVGGDPIDPARFAVDLARRIPERVTACVGLHPHDAADYSEPLHVSLRELARAPEVAAVGEIGLDYHYDHSPREQQRAVFAALIGLAREVRKPIVVHTRSAPDDTLDILEREGAREVGGIIHCFSEDRRFAARALDLGFDLSFSGIVTFKNAQAVQDVAGWAPLDRILVETDSPYLAPVPFRGKKCEPALVLYTARHMAELRAIAPEVLAEATLRNTERRFGTTFARP